MRLLKYCWFHTVMFLTACLPDVTPVLKLRGLLARPAFKKCGRNLQVARHVTINYPHCLEIGRDVYFAQGCWIHAVGGISIEDQAQFGPYVVVVTGDHGRTGDSFRHGVGKRAPIRVGAGSWIGAHATLTKGVTIGRGSLVGANAVVTHDVPDNGVVGGVPAKLIKVLDEQPAPGRQN